MFPFNPSSNYYYPSQGSSSMMYQASSGRSSSSRFGPGTEPASLMASSTALPASYYGGAYSSPAGSNTYSSASSGSAPTSSYNSECTCPYCIPGAQSVGHSSAGYPPRMQPGSPISAPPQPMYSHNPQYGYPGYPQQPSYYSHSNVQPGQAGASPQQQPQQSVVSSTPAGGERKRKKRSSSKDESMMSSSSSGSLSRSTTVSSAIKEEYESDGFDDFGLDEDSELKTEKDSGKEEESPEFNLDFHLSPESDGYRWRKYGRKTVKGSPYPRSYYKCTFPYCTVKKQVEAVFKEGKLASTNSIYKGEHNHERPCVTHVTANDQASFRNAVLAGFVRHEKMAARSNNTPRLVVSTTRTIDYLDDGYRWRKYGQKYVKGSGYPRSYYKCTEKSCTVKKQVDQLGGASSQALSVTYEGIHTHPPSLSKTNTRKRRRRANSKEEPVKEEEEEEAEVPVKSEKTSDLHNAMLPPTSSLSDVYQTHEFSVPAPRQQQSYSSSGQYRGYQQPSTSASSGWYGSTSTMPSRPAYYPSGSENTYSSMMSAAQSSSSKMPIYGREKDEFSFDRSSPGGGGIAVGGGGGGVAVAMPSHTHMPFGPSSSPMIASPSPVATPASTSTPNVATDYEPAPQVSNSVSAQAQPEQTNGYHTTSASGLDDGYSLWHSRLTEDLPYLGGNSGEDLGFGAGSSTSRSASLPFFEDDSALAFYSNSSLHLC